MQTILELLAALIRATSWKMEIPKAYGVFHLSSLVIGFSLCFLIAWKLRRLNDKQHRRLMVGIGVFLTVTEIYKQLFYLFAVNGSEYAWGIFPFHLCSIPMYLCIIAPLLKRGTPQNAMYSFMMLYNLLGGGIAFFEPSGLLHSYVTLTIHAMVWHMLLVFIGLYLLFSGRGGSSAKDYRNATTLFLILCCMAFAINLAFRKVSNGQLNMFFIGPGNSTLIVFKQISEWLGWYVSTALYIPAVCLGAYLICLLARLYHRRSTELRTNVSCSAHKTPR